MSVTKLGHEMTIFDVPHCDETSIISRDDGLELTVIESEGYWELVRSFDFFLSLEEPQVDLSRTEQDVVSVAIEKQRGKSVFWSVWNFVKDSLGAPVGNCVPNLNHLVGTE